MTLDQRTDSELNRIVAEWMEYVEHDQLNEEGGFEYSYWQNKNGNAVNIFFCSDLNACAEVNATLTMEQRERWVCLISGVEKDQYLTRFQQTQQLIRLCMATARQRTEALVKVIEEK